MDPQLIDRIYECAFVPEMWPDVLGELAKIAGTRRSSLCVLDGRHPRILSSEKSIVAVIAQLFASGLMEKSQRIASLDSRPNAGFLREIDIADERGVDWRHASAEEIKHWMAAEDPLYRYYLLPRGLGWAVATGVRLPTSDRIYISMEREFDKGPVEDRAVDQLNQLRPHLARSALMAARLQLKHARTASQTLASLGLAALVLDDAGKVLAADELIEQQAGVIHWRAQDRFTLADSRADALLRDALVALDTPVAAVRSFPVRNADGEPALVAHVIPIRRAVQDIFARCAAALVLTPVTAPGAPPVELVQSLFDLTPAEARVARNLAAGKTVEDMAIDGRVSVHTVRTQMRSVLEKTGCSRQAEAVALLSGVSLTRGLAN